MGATSAIGRFEPRPLRPCLALGGTVFKKLAPCMCFALAGGLLVLPGVLSAQSVETGRGARGLIAGPIDENRLHTVAGNTRPEATPQNDRGRVSDALQLDHMLLQLQRTPEQEQAVQQFVDSLQTAGSPNYHQWLTAAEFGERFGAAQADIDKITGWLRSYGFTVNSVSPSGMAIDFSGTAGQVLAAFHTEIHNLQVNGQSHIANMSDPRIPEALAPVVAGVVSLHDFRPHPMSRPHAAYTFTSGGTTYQAVVPADLATIYNLNPLFSGGISGQGQTIAVVEDTNLYSSTDWSTFRSEFGLSQYTAGSLQTIHPGIAAIPECLRAVMMEKPYWTPSGPAPPRLPRRSRWLPVPTPERRSAA